LGSCRSSPLLYAKISFLSLDYRQQFLQCLPQCLSPEYHQQCLQCLLQCLLQFLLQSLLQCLLQHQQ
jgi:hypothetical protein